MPVKLDREKQAWVKVQAPPKKPSKPKYSSLADEKEALCAKLRYFACQPFDGRDRIRMLNRPMKGDDGMVEVDRAPSPVPDQWTGAGLKFENGARGGGPVSKKKLRRDRERGFHMESDDGEDVGHRVASEPVRAPRARSRSRARTYIEDDKVEVTEEPSLYDEDIRSRRSYRRSRRQHDYEDDPRPGPTHHDEKSRRSASPPPAAYALSVRSTRQREPRHAVHEHPTTRPQARHVTAPVPTKSVPRSTPMSSTYQFQSAIFQSRNSGNHYRNVYSGRNKDGSVGPASWAVATSALSFD